MVNYSQFGGNSNDSNNNSDSDERQDLTLKVTPYAAIDFDLDAAFSVDGQYGQSLATTANNATLVDGALYERTDGKAHKVFGWGSLGYNPGEEEITADDAPRKYSETFGSRTYNYELVAARYDEEDPDTEQPEIGNVIMWESGGEHGPSSSAKTFARTLTNKGRAAVIDEGDINAWLDTDVQLRDDLEGRRVRFYKIEREGEEHNFYSPVFLDLALEQQITIKNGSEDDATEETAEEEQEAAETEAATEEAVEAEADDEAADVAPGGFSEQIEEFITFCRDQEITAEDAVLKTLDTMVSNPASAVDEDMVAGQESEIVAAVQG